MKKYKNNLGNMTFAIVIEGILIAAGVIFFFASLSEFPYCFIALAVAAFGIFMLFGTLKDRQDSKACKETEEKGHPGVGYVTSKDWSNLKDSNDSTDDYYYYVNFTYTNDLNETVSAHQEISEETYNILEKSTPIPLIIYKERGIFLENDFLNATKK